MELGKMSGKVETARIWVRMADEMGSCRSSVFLQ